MDRFESRVENVRVKKLETSGVLREKEDSRVTMTDMIGKPLTL